MIYPNLFLKAQKWTKNHAYAHAQYTLCIPSASSLTKFDIKHACSILLLCHCGPHRFIPHTDVFPNGLPKHDIYSVTDLAELHPSVWKILLYPADFLY